MAQPVLSLCTTTNTSIPLSLAAAVATVAASTAQESTVLVGIEEIIEAQPRRAVTKPSYGRFALNLWVKCFNKSSALLNRNVHSP